MNLIKWWNINIGNEEKKKLNYALTKKFISQGPLTMELEKKISKFLNVKNTILVPSGSQAMLLALLSLDLKPGDEVITQNVAWISLINSLKILNLKVILIDVQKNRPIININSIKKNITKKTKVIIPVHLNGRVTNMNEILKIVKNRKIKVIEDAAQSFGVKDKNFFLGTKSDIGVFSMAMSKAFTSGQGGFLTTNNNSLAKKLKKMRNQGADNINQIYEWNNFGFNFKFTDLQAAIGLVQLRKFKKNKIKLINNFLIYSRLLKEIKKYIYPANINIKNGEIPTYNEFICKNRSGLHKYLMKNGIETREFYPNLEKVNYIKMKKNIFFNSKIYETSSLYLPSGPNLKVREIKKIVKYIKIFYKNNSRYHA